MRLIVNKATITGLEHFHFLAEVLELVSLHMLGKTSDVHSFIKFIGHGRTTHSDVLKAMSTDSGMCFLANQSCDRDLHLFAGLLFSCHEVASSGTTNVLPSVIPSFCVIYHKMPLSVNISANSSRIFIKL